MAKKLKPLADRPLAPVSCPGCHRVWMHAPVSAERWCLTCAPSPLAIPYPKRTP